MSSSRLVVVHPLPADTRKQSTQATMRCCTGAGTVFVGPCNSVLNMNMGLAWQACKGTSCAALSASAAGAQVQGVLFECWR